MAIVLAAFLVYADSLGNGFVADDYRVIVHNPALRGTPLSLFSDFDTTSSTQLLPFYRPLTYLTFLIEDRLNELTPFPVRLANVALHALSSLLVYYLARSLLEDRLARLLAGLLFAVHPLHAEGVDFNAGGRNTMLSCCFVLSAFLLHRSSVIKGGIVAAYGGAVLYLAGVFSKETGLMVLPFVVGQEIGPFRTSGTRFGPRAFARVVPYAVGTVGYLVMRWMTLSRLGIQATLLPGITGEELRRSEIIPGLRERLLNDLHIIPKYFQTVVWPLHLSPRYDVHAARRLVTPSIVAAWLCILLIAGWLLWRGRSRVTAFGVAWLVAFWLPVSGIVYISRITMADRFLYVPAIGLWIVVADQAARFLPSGGSRRRYALTAVAVALCLLAALTMRRNLDWKNDVTLFGRLVSQYPENPHGHYSLGNAYLDDRGEYDLELAEREYLTALALDPTLQSAYAPLGYIRMVKQDYAGALRYYSRALQYDPMSRSARVNRGLAYEKLGRVKEALADYEFYLTLPGYNDIRGSREFAEERIRKLSRP
ncbi:MAG: tetratricopeptide repeat protein [Acidobacteriia bacterium]|nr:tetratricopeptide repeat protein [Terriglobia bacterium]